MKLNINPEYQKLLPRISQEEWDTLKSSIKTDGLLYPIVVNQENIILDGHNRFLICNELGVPFQTVVREFIDKLEEKRFVIEVNLKRRHLNDFQKAELGMVLLEVEAELARQRKIGTLMEGEKLPLAPIDAIGKAAEVVAKKIGLSGRTFERAKKIIEIAPEQIKKKVREGKQSISSAYSQIVTPMKKPKLEIIREEINSLEPDSFNELKNILLILVGFLERHKILKEEKNYLNKLLGKVHSARKG